jgi:hypothetical protein
MFAVIRCKKPYGSLFFAELTITGIVYMNFHIRQQDDIRPDTLFQQYGVLPHFLPISKT